MAEIGFQNTLIKLTDGKARLQGATVKSPWDKFLATLDSNPKMPDSEVKTLFAQTLSKSSSDWKDPNDNTLLMHMASRGQTGIVKRLIHEFYANVNATNKDGLTALHMAARSGSMETCVALTDAYADPCKKDRNGSTPAMIAKDQGHAAVADFLGNREVAKRVWLAGHHLSNQQG